MESRIQKQNNDMTPRIKKRVNGRNINLIISVVMAIVLWMYVLVEVNPETTLPWKEIPVQLLNVESLKENKLSLMGDQDYIVTVRIKGKRNDVTNVRANQIIAEADLSDVKRGENYIPVDVKVLLDGVTVEQVSPVNLTVRVEKIIQVTKNVQVQYKGTGPTGKEAEVIAIEPSKIMLEGTESNIAKVSKVTAAVELDKIREDQHIGLSVAPVDENGDFVKEIVMEKDTVRADVVLLPVKEVPFEIIIADKEESDTSVSVEQQPEAVRIKARQDILDTISVIKSRPVDASLLTESKEIPVTPELPEGVYLSRSNPSMRAGFLVEKLVVKTFSYTIEDVEVIGLAEGLQCEIADVQITVTVKGNQERINSINKNTIGLSLNVSEFGEGQHTTALTCSAVQDAAVFVEPEQIAFQITSL